MIKKGKEIRMNKNYDNYKVISGTVDSKNPTSVYINITAWGEPIDEDIVEYVMIISGIKKEIKKHIYSKLPLTFNKQRTIIDLDMRKSGITYGKRSFMSCEITLFQNLRDNKLLLSDNLKKLMGDITDNVINEVLEKNKNFKFHKKKQ